MLGPVLELVGPCYSGGGRLASHPAGCSQGVSDSSFITVVSIICEVFSGRIR